MAKYGFIDHRDNANVEKPDTGIRVIGLTPRISSLNDYAYTELIPCRIASLQKSAAFQQTNGMP